jgi:hypothetical protein
MPRAARDSEARLLPDVEAIIGQTVDSARQLIE